MDHRSKGKTIKLLRKKIGENLCCVFELVKIFRYITKSMIIKRKKIIIIRLHQNFKNFCSVEDIGQSMDKHTIAWEHMFANNKSDKGTCIQII